MTTREIVYGAATCQLWAAYLCYAWLTRYMAQAQGRICFHLRAVHTAR